MHSRSEYTSSVFQVFISNTVDFLRITFELYPIVVQKKIIVYICIILPSPSLLSTLYIEKTFGNSSPPLVFRNSHPKGVISNSCSSLFWEFWQEISCEGVHFFVKQLLLHYKKCTLSRVIFKSFEAWVGELEEHLWEAAFGCSSVEFEKKSFLKCDVP